MENNFDIHNWQAKYLTENKQLQEGKVLTAYNFKGEPIEIDLTLIDALAQQIGQASGYGDWQERVSNLDYNRIIQSLAKRVLKLGDLQSDPIKFTKA
jgi:hypothetical protein